MGEIRKFRRGEPDERDLGGMGDQFGAVHHQRSAQKKCDGER